jgi:hypothetical protein
MGMGENVEVRRKKVEVEAKGGVAREPFSFSEVIQERCEPRQEQARDERDDFNDRKKGRAEVNIR